MCHLFTTVQLDGQLLIPLVIVESVPSVVGQVNVPAAATFCSQLLVAIPAQAVNATSTELNDVQF